MFFTSTGICRSWRSTLPSNPGALAQSGSALGWCSNCPQELSPSSASDWATNSPSRIWPLDQPRLLASQEPKRRSAMAQYRIGQAILSPEQPDFDQMLGSAYNSRLRPICQCVGDPGIPMYIVQINGRFWPKQMPNPGANTPSAAP